MENEAALESIAESSIVAETDAVIDTALSAVEVMQDW